ncbi:SAM-dependent methyltransferase, partial [Mesorhizobium sp. M7A.F.Ca.AU.001.01.1.1]
AQRYVLDVLAANGLSVLSLEPTAIRQDRGEHVNGLVVVARAPNSAEQKT